MLVPAWVFYVATTALVVVSIFLVVLLVVLITLVRELLNTMRFMREKGEWVARQMTSTRDAIRAFRSIFFK